MKGILFKPWKIKAIVANPVKEWQTRREMQNQPTEMDKCYETAFKKDFGGRVPRYHVGETVYIKEAWAAYEFAFCTEQALPNWKHEGYHWHPVTHKLGRENYAWGLSGEPKWRNPRTMPACAARHFIKITQVEACRTKDISFEDCLAEGVVDCPFWQNLGYKAPAPLHPENLTNDEADKEIDRGWIAYAQQAYFALYDSINGKGAHEHNWDWKYSFIKVDNPEIPHSP